MKITTWNVNGYRAVLRKEAFDWVSEIDPDVLCLQEIKVKPEQISEQEQSIEGYTAIWNPAERPGYSGTAVFVKNPPLEREKGFGIVKFDVEGRLIRIRYPGFLLYNIYFPNGGQDNWRVSYKLEFYESLLDICDELHANCENIIITGDFNTAHSEIDLAHPKANEKNTGFLPEERVWIDKYLEHGFVDIFRERYPESVAYTWWTYRTKARAKNIGWRLDYYLISEKLVSKIEDVIIHSDVMGSDHCPVSLLLKD
ncbi:MAG: exodeoxyribonuclease III [Chloroflexota bacterium]